MKIIVNFLLMVLMSLSFSSGAYAKTYGEWEYDYSHSIGKVHAFKYHVDESSYLGLTCNPAKQELFFYAQKKEQSFKVSDLKKIVGESKNGLNYYTVELTSDKFDYRDFIFMFAQYEYLTVGDAENSIKIHNLKRESGNVLWSFKEFCSDGVLLYR